MEHRERELRESKIEDENMPSFYLQNISKVFIQIQNEIQLSNKIKTQSIFN